MYRRLFLLASAAGLPLSGCTEKQTDYVNIVLMNLDDVGYGDFSCNGAYGYSTPNIDKLAGEGVKFTE